MPPRPPGHDEEPFELAILSSLGPVDGAQVLELGCGDGELTFRLIDAGAEVTALDLSPRMVSLARGRFSRFRPGAPVRWVVAPAEATGLAGESFDAIVGKWILHHVDLPAATAEIARLLRPGGRGVFVETSALNPLLALTRRLLPGRLGVTRYGTADERPLRRRDLALLRHHFAHVEVDFPNFVLFYLFDRNLARWRWKRISRLCLALDRLAGQLPRLGPLSYYMRVCVGKPRSQ